jgi:hypothetical protein
VANVERFPPFHDEALIAFEKTKDEVVVSLSAFSKKSWLQLGQESATGFQKLIFQRKNAIEAQPAGART